MATKPHLLVNADSQMSWKTNFGLRLFLCTWIDLHLVFLCVARFLSPTHLYLKVHLAWTNVIFKSRIFHGRMHWGIYYSISEEASSLQLHDWPLRFFWPSARKRTPHAWQNKLEWFLFMNPVLAKRKMAFKFIRNGFVLMTVAICICFLWVHSPKWPQSLTLTCACL